METKIKPTETGVEIDITGTEGKQDQLLEAFQECSEGRCTCQTEEYKKVESLRTVTSDQTIHISIKSKPDEVIDAAEIEKCLEHTKKSVGSKA